MNGWDGEGAGFITDRPGHKYHPIDPKQAFTRNSIPAARSNMLIRRGLRGMIWLIFAT
jgi:hypothetical protein